MLGYPLARFMTEPCDVKDAWSCRLCLEDYIDDGYFPKEAKERCETISEYLKDVDYIVGKEGYYLKKVDGD
jgi:hypothetical protein